LKTFIDTTDKSFTFSSCEGCPAKCCDGREGTIFSQLILEDFEVVSKNFPILFTFGEMGYLKAVILFSDGTNFCPYIKDHKCTIYDERPSICRVYPLSPNIDNKVYIDDSCPAIGNNLENKIVDLGKITTTYQYKTLENYQDKYINTHIELEKINNKNDFELVFSINNVTFYKYIGSERNEYINYHISSLIKNYII
jgi:Fe-S-cluster containining protein